MPATDCSGPAPSCRERRAALKPPTVITPVSVVEAQLAFRTSVASPQHLPQGCSYYQPSLSFPRSSLQVSPSAASAGCGVAR